MGFFSKLLEATPMGAGNLFFGKDVDSNKAANQYLDQIPGMARKNLSPYIKPGEEAQGFVDQIMKGYTPSEGYNFQKAELEKSLGNTAAAGGYAGGEYDQMQRGKLIQSLLSGDMQQYLENVLGVHNQSYGASRDLTDIEGGALNQQGGMAFSQAENKNQRRYDMQNALMKMAAGAFGASKGMPFGGSSGSAGGGGWGREALFNNSKYGRGPVGSYGASTPGAAFGGR